MLRKKAISLVSEFNRAQAEAGKSTIGSTSALSWLKSERPKVAIYPHHMNYCDFCVVVKKEIQSHQQTIGCVSPGMPLLKSYSNVNQLKRGVKHDLRNTKNVVRLSSQYY